METQYSELDIQESKLLSYNGLDLSDVFRYCLDIFDNQQEGSEKTYVIQVGNDIRKPPLIFLHGYLGCSACYSPLFKKLSEKFLVLAVDLRGFGRSSRPKFTCNTVKETQDFFLLALEATFKKMDLQKTTFFLAGHSLGGYLAVLYAEKHPHQIRQLFLVSPLGLKVKDEMDTFDLQSVFEITGPSSFISKHIEEIQTNFGKEDWSVYGVIRNTMMMKRTLKEYMRSEYKLKQEFLDNIDDYMIEIIKMTPSGEYCYNKLFDFPFFSKENLSQALEETMIPTNLIFGEIDVLYDDNIFELQTKNASYIKINIISNSGHMIHFMNPQDLASTIIFETKENLMSEPESPIPFF